MDSHHASPKTKNCSRLMDRQPKMISLRLSETQEAGGSDLLRFSKAELRVVFHELRAALCPWETGLSP